MKWPTSSSDLNRMENPWSIVTMTSYEGNKQYNSKADKKKALKTTKSEIEPGEVKKK